MWAPGREDSRLPWGTRSCPRPAQGRCGALYSPRASSDSHSSMKTWPVQGEAEGDAASGATAGARPRRGVLRHRPPGTLLRNRLFGEQDALVN